MRVAILDLGTNTFHLLIAEVKAGSEFKILFRTRAVVKLGSEKIEQDRIAEKPFARGLRAMLHFKRRMKQYRVRESFAFATSAIRSSINGKQFAALVKKQTGIPVTLISGEEEARLICYGIRRCVPLNEEPVLMLDIGGGSTEFIIANAKKIFWMRSFDIGAARLLAGFNPSDPIRKKEIKEIELYLGRTLQPLWKAVKSLPVKKLVGASGSFDTFAQVIRCHFQGRKGPAGLSYRFDLKEYKRLHSFLLNSTVAERNKTKGLIKMRVDMIVLASIFTSLVLKKLQLKEMIMSKYALKEGALWKVMQSANKTKMLA